MWRDLSIVAVSCGLAASVAFAFCVGLVLGAAALVSGADSAAAGADESEFVVLGTLASAAVGGYVAAVLRPGAELTNAVASALLGLAIGLVSLGPVRSSELALPLVVVAVLYVGSAALGGFLRRKLAAA